jgi:hypothetical protein
MQEKGWSSPSAVGATADQAENEEPVPNKGLRFKNIGGGLQSAARSIGDEIHKIGSAIGNMFTADSVQNEKTESSTGLTLEDFRRGLQSAARNIGDEIPKIGPAIRNMFKQLVNQDTRDNDTDEPTNKLEGRPPKDKK